MMALRPFCCCIAEGDLFTGDATRRKIRCLQETLRGVTGVPPAFRDSLLQVDDVLFLPSPSLQNVNKYVTGKEDTHFIERWGHKPFKSSAAGKHKAQATWKEEIAVLLPPIHHLLGSLQSRPQPSHRKSAVSTPSLDGNQPWF
jgi:hypothetical protein